MKLTDLGLVNSIKLASIAVHAEEFLATYRTNPPASQFDEAALKGLLADPQVREVLDDAANAVFLPVKRTAAIEVEQ